MNRKRLDGLGILKVAVLTLGLVLAGFTTLLQAGGEAIDTGLNFVVVVKSSNYAQNDRGELKLLNYHFFSEIFPTEPDTEVSGKLWRDGAEQQAMTYVERKSNYYIEGGHFDSLQAVDTAYPNGLYRFSIKTDKLDIRNEPLTLSDARGQTDIPSPIRISLVQDETEVSPAKVDPGKGLTIQWSEYSNGRSDPRGIVDDMIFVVLQNCQGERIVHTGLPFAGPYMTYQTRQIRVAAGELQPGEPYSMFVEFPHVVDSRIVQGVPVFSSYATATYLDLHTLGERENDDCLEAMPPMDTGQTDR